MSRYEAHPLTLNETTILRRLLDGSLYGGQLLHESDRNPGSAQMPYEVLWRLERMGLVASERESGRGVKRMYEISALGLSVFGAWTDYCYAWTDAEPKRKHP